jgi:hypothetical protein
LYTAAPAWWTTSPQEGRKPCTAETRHRKPRHGRGSVPVARQGLKEGTGSRGGPGGWSYYGSHLRCTRLVIPSFLASEFGHKVHPCRAWWCTPISPATQEAEVGGSWSEVGASKSTRPYLKYRLKAKKTVVERLPSKCEALSSIPGTTKKKKNRSQKPNKFTLSAAQKGLRVQHQRQGRHRPLRPQAESLGKLRPREESAGGAEPGLTKNSPEAVTV